MPTPVVFVHGLWIHSSAWAPWADRFRDAGYEPHAPGWPGEPDTIEEAKAHPEYVAGKGVDDVVDHIAKFIATLSAKPIVIGHSFGGVIVQKLLDMDAAVAAVSIDAAPIKGVLRLPLSSVRVASIAIRNPTNLRKSVSLSKREFRYGFGNAISDEESNALWAKTIPSPGRPLFEAATANFVPNPPTRINVRNATRGPLLLIAGGRDRTAPAAVQRATARMYARSDAGTDIKQFPDRGHSLTIDSGWGEIADYAIEWLHGKGL